MPTPESTTDQQKLIARIVELLPKEKAEKSEIHTSDIHYLSSTGIMLEQNKGANKLRSEVIRALPKIIELVEKETKKSYETRITLDRKDEECGNIYMCDICKYCNILDDSSYCPNCGRKIIK